MVTFDTPQPIISFERPFRPNWARWAGLGEPTRPDPTQHEMMFSHLQMMSYDEKMRIHPEILDLG